MLGVALRVDSALQQDSFFAFFLFNSKLLDKLFCFFLKELKNSINNLNMGVRASRNKRITYVLYKGLSLVFILVW